MYESHTQILLMECLNGAERLRKQMLTMIMVKGRGRKDSVYLI